MGPEDKDNNEEKKSFFTKVIDKGINLSEKVGDTVSKAKDSMIDMIPEVDIDYIEEKLGLLGYKVPKVEIAITVPPRVSLEIDLEQSVIDKIAKKELEDSIEFTDENETETNKVLIKIIQGLDTAAKLNDKLKFKNKKISRVVVEGSIIPTVKLIYLDPDVNAEAYLRDS